MTKLMPRLSITQSHHLRHSLIGVLLLSVLVAAGMAPGIATAACAAQDTSWGQASSNFTIPTTGTYRVWSRILAPDTTNNSYSLNIDGTTCGVVVGDGGISANTWTWVNYKNGSSGSPIDVSLTAGSHSLTVIGRENSVELDRIIFTTDPACVPSGAGDNCVIVVATDPGGGTPGTGNNPGTTPNPSKTGTNSGGTVTVHASTNPVTVASGTDLVIAPNGVENGNVTKVEYFIDNKLVATETKAPYTYKVVTANLSNGTHVLTSKVFYTDGTTKSTTQKLNITNTASKKKSNTSSTIGISLVLVAAIIGGLILIQRSRGGFRWRGVTLIPADHPMGEDVAAAIHTYDTPADPQPQLTQVPTPGSVIEYQPSPDEPPEEHPPHL